MFLSWSFSFFVKPLSYKICCVSLFLNRPQLTCNLMRGRYTLDPRHCDTSTVRRSCLSYGQGSWTPWKCAHGAFVRFWDWSSALPKHKRNMHSLPVNQFIHFPQIGCWTSRSFLLAYLLLFGDKKGKCIEIHSCHYLCNSGEDNSKTCLRKMYLEAW